MLSEYCERHRLQRVCVGHGPCKSPEMGQLTTHKGHGLPVGDACAATSFWWSTSTLTHTPPTCSLDDRQFPGVSSRRRLGGICRPTDRDDQSYFVACASRCSFASTNSIMASHSTGARVRGENAHPVMSAEAVLISTRLNRSSNAGRECKNA